jgi:hypothetical protein
MKNLSKTILAVLATGVISCGLFCQQAQAIASSDLATLAANPNNSISFGDKTFDHFTFNATSGLNLFDASGITVTAGFDPVSGAFTLTYVGNISAMNLTGAFAGDLTLNYRVTATAGSIFMIDQNYTGSATSGSLLTVDETARVGGVNVANSHLQFLIVGNTSLVDFSDPPAETGDSLNVNPPQSVLDVTKDILLTGTNGVATVSQVQQSFHQLPDGGSAVALLGIALAGIEGVRRLVRTRKA